MFLTSEYKIDIWELKRQRDPEDFEKYMLRTVAKKFGIFLSEKLLFEKIEGVDDGVDPKEQPFPISYKMNGAPKHTYRLELLVTRQEQWSSFKNRLYNLLSGTISGHQKAELIKLLKELESV